MRAQTMKINLLTLFPNFFSSPFESSILSRAIQEEIINVDIHDLRKWGEGKHKQVDDTSYGGGPGMVIRPDVIENAIREIMGSFQNSHPKFQIKTWKNHSRAISCLHTLYLLKNVLPKFKDFGINNNNNE